MSKYAEVSKVNDEIVRVLEHTDCKDEYIDRVLMAIEKIPTIDIVHCKDCMQNTINTDGATEPWCYKFGYEVEDTDFCSYGERIDNE